MVYDCFLFYNELELLDIRLHELNDVVDMFVLAEATVTHTNKPKKLYYDENKSLFKQFHKKIVHVIIDDSPDVNLPWIIERFQLEALSRGLKKCKPKDIILYSAVDEIPKAQKILEWKNKTGKNKVFKQKLSYYFLNCFETSGHDWFGTRMFSYKDMLTYPSIYFPRYSKTDVIITDGGWHFSYMGGIKKIQQKMISMAHQEFNNDNYNTKEKILRAIADRHDFLGHGYKFKIKDIDNLPNYVIENKVKFKDLLAEEYSGRYKFQKLVNLYWKLKNTLRLFYRNLRRIYTKYMS